MPPSQFDGRLSRSTMQHILIALVAIAAAVFAAARHPGCGRRLAASRRRRRAALRLRARRALRNPFHPHHFDSRQPGGRRAQDLWLFQPRARPHHRDAAAKPATRRRSSRPAASASRFSSMCSISVDLLPVVVGAQRFLWPHRRQRRRLAAGRPDHGRRLAGQATRRNSSTPNIS